ncbi:MAG TPA: AraC family transcriptional regulator [Burkholderiales bacterium]|nr:AraC family transcriptional regulator [Burkholderiales bacterium]
MSLSVETPHRSPALAVHIVRCRPEHHACGPVEHAAADMLVLPLRGIFVKHEGPERLVADPCHALFFEAGAPYRVSHPVEGGDECLTLEPSRELLAEGASREKCTPLDERLIATRSLLGHRLRRGLATSLEAEETALGLYLGIGRRASCSRPATRARRRHAEMVEATKVTLAAQPGQNWALSELAQRVYSSPWHLARVFGELAGVPLHRYHLRARLAAALREVLDTARDFTAIGLDLGFASHSHFTASFRRAFGVTPSALRKSKILTAQ